MSRHDQMTLSVVISCHHSTGSLHPNEQSLTSVMMDGGMKRTLQHCVITNKNIIMYELSSYLPTGHILCLVCNINIPLLSSLKYFLNVKIRDLDKLVLESWKRFFFSQLNSIEPNEVHLCDGNFILVSSCYDSGL